MKLLSHVDVRIRCNFLEKSQLCLWLNFNSLKVSNKLFSWTYGPVNPAVTAMCRFCENYTETSSAKNKILIILKYNKRLLYHKSLSDMQRILTDFVFISYSLNLNSTIIRLFPTVSFLSFLLLMLHYLIIFYNPSIAIPWVIFDQSRIINSQT